jgi:hypothetical protein
MAIILTKDTISLFISYAPGTGSTALEQHLRTNEFELLGMGFQVEHFPPEEFGINSIISRHICYADFSELFGGRCDFVATCTRNPFNYYYSEYRRIQQKWVLLLNDKNSWIYHERSNSTRLLAIAAKNSVNFNSWLYDIFIDVRKDNKEYLYINEDHINMTTNFIRSENMNDSFNSLIYDVFDVQILPCIGNFPNVNVTVRDQVCSGLIQLATRNLGVELFHDYMGRFLYSFEESELFLIKHFD